MIRGSEEYDIAIRAPRSFETLIGLLSIVQSRSKAVNLDMRVLDELWFRPFPYVNCEGGLDMTIDWDCK